jgi:hypothetical protein
MKFKQLLLIKLALLISSQAFAVGIKITRCPDDQLGSNAGIKRHQFGMKCVPEYVDAVYRTNMINFEDDQINPMVKDAQGNEKRKFSDIKTMDFKIYITENERTPEFGYPSFQHIEGGIAKSLVEFKDSLNINTKCDVIPRTAKATRICPAGCYLGNQFVLFDSKYLPIEEAEANGVKSLITLTSEASVENLSFQKTPLKQIIKDSVLVEQDFLKIETINGEIIVTPFHPMLKENGYMVAADKLSVGDKLLRASGEADTIVEITRSSHKAYAYNVIADTNELQSKIVVSQDFLTGDLYYQNAGTKYLNRFLLRQQDML